MLNAVLPSRIMAETNSLRELSALHEGPTGSPVDKKEVAKPKGAEPCRMSFKERPIGHLREAEDNPKRGSSSLQREGAIMPVIVRM
jgi:hypothetical protein